MDLKRLAPFSKTELLIISGDYLGASSKFSDPDKQDILIALDNLAPYVSNKKERKLKKIIIENFRTKKESIKKPVLFTNIHEAMALLGKKLKNTQPENQKEIKDIEYWEEKYDVLKPSVEFSCVPMNRKVGFTKGDAVLMGNVAKIKQALKAYPFVVDSFSTTTAIIRNIVLMGIRKDYLYIPKISKTKSKYKKGDWRNVIDEKYKEEPLLIDAFIRVVAKKFKNKIITTDIFPLHKGHYYLLLLPKEVSSLPYCTLRMGKVIPIITNWVILGI